MAIGESPGGQERSKGFPLVGPSGEIFFSAFPEDVDVDKIAYISNALQCLPKKSAGVKDPQQMWRATQSCSSRLLKDIKKYPRKVILAMGNFAAGALLGNSNFKITKERGKLFTSPLAEVGIIPAVHPAALLRGTGNYRQFVADVRYALHLSQGGDVKKFVKAKVYVVSDPGCAKSLAKFLKTQPYLANDIEATGLSRRSDRVLCIGIAYKPEIVFVFTPNVIKHLKPLFESKTPRFIWQNGKFDIGFLRRDGLPARVDEDTMLLSYALDESGGIHGLEQISSDLLGAPDYKYMVKPWIKKKGDSYDLIPKKVLYEYCGIDVSLTLQNFHILRPWVREDDNLEKLYTKVLIPASELLYHVERAGIQVDLEHIEKIERFYRIKRNAAHWYVERVIGRPINLNSPDQVAKLLYDDMGLKPKRRGERSTAKEILEKLPQNGVVKAIRRFRKASKAYSTYVTGIYKVVDSETGRVYATFKIHGTRTGRLSSAEPNLQNIPRESLLRGMFVARPGHKLIEIDLNQAELRSLACLSNDPILIDIYTSTDRSIHDELAVKLYGKDFDHEGKMRAKMLNFGIIYGREGPSIAEQLGIAVREGWRMVHTWFETFPVAHKFIKACRKCPRQNRTITTTFGRKKRHRIVAKSNLKTLQNEAANFPHQSIVSDITLLAAIRLRPILQAIGVEIVNLIHDSILIECPDDPAIIDAAKKLCIGVMESIGPEWGLTRVPFKAEGKIGDRWGEDYMEDATRPEPPPPPPEPLKEAA
jgi:uracil-DNA glycosylase family 4